MSGLFVAPLLALSGCNTIEHEINNAPGLIDEPDANPLEAESYTDHFIQADSEKVDILFVVDDSCSMEEDQARLTQNFPYFFEYFDASGVDYHIGVVTTDMNDPDKSGKLQPAFGLSYLDPLTDEDLTADGVVDDHGLPIDSNDVFVEMAAVGITGYHEERGLDAAYAGVRYYQGNGEPNDGFLRPDALLDFIVVTDEADQSLLMNSHLFSQAMFDLELEKAFASLYGHSPTTHDWEALAPGAYADIEALSQDFVSMHSIVKKQGDTCEIGSDGRVYLEVSNQIGGGQWSICAQDWAPMLEEIGSVSAGLKREYFLSHLPYPPSIEVYIEYESDSGIPVSETPMLGVEFMYKPSRNSIEFLENQDAPPPGGRLSVTYELMESYPSE